MRPRERHRSFPRVLAVESKRVTFREPRVWWDGPEPKRANGAVEFLVRTSAALPIRGLSPVLIVGEVAVGICQQAGKNLYRYFAYDAERLRPGAPISFGFPQLPRLQVETPFRYQPDRPPVS